MVLEERGRKDLESVCERWAFFRNRGIKLKLLSEQRWRDTKHTSAETQVSLVLLLAQ